MNRAGPIVERAIEQALQAAVTAPSLFNSQPWRVRTLGNTVLIGTDRSRRLPVHDPYDRELLIACGSFTVYAEIALQAAGLICDVEHLPDLSSLPDVVAALQVKSGAPGSPQDEHAHALAAVRDRTEYDRRPFATAPVDDAQVTALRAAAEAEGAWLVVLDDARRIEAAVLHTHADDILRADRDAVEELQLWTRHGEDYDDGVPAHGVNAHSDERACSLPLRDFDLDPHQPGTAPEPPEVERPMIALLCTAHDSPADAVTAGRALGRVLLEAAAAGLAASPLNQALQTATRWRLPSALSLTGVPQYQLRIGTPSGAPLPAHRRKLAHDPQPAERGAPRSGPTTPTLACSSNQQADASVLARRCSPPDRRSADRWSPTRAAD